MFLRLTLPILFLPLLSAAQAPTTQPGGSSGLSVYLMTMGPGPAVYEWFGHNAIVIVDHRKNVSYAFNYGMFDFEEPGFLSKFIEGKMMYWMDAYDGDKLLQSYTKDDRTIWMQQLNLSDRQKLRLASIVSQQQGKRYLYNYYTANCSTKVRDALDDALDGQLKAQLTKIPTGTTYRWHSQRLAAGNLPIYTSMFFILGHNVDKPLTAWEESFLPVQLMIHLQNVTIRDGNTPPLPLILSTEQKHRSASFTERPTPPNWTLHFLIAGTIYGAILILLARRCLPSPGTPGDGRVRVPRVTFAFLSLAWSLLAAFAGCFALWTFTTDHWSVYWNENILQLTPLSLPLILLAPMTIFNKRSALRPALFFSAAALLTSILGLILQLLPGFYQVNGPIIALCLPIHLGLALSIYLLYRRNPPAAAMMPEPSPL